MRVPYCLREAAMFIGMCALCGVGLVIAGSIGIGGFTVLAILFEKYIPLIKEVLL